jgi:asparagine synthase (glutamine-hydrolysing)
MRKGTVTITNYWRLEKKELHIAYADAKAEIQRLLGQSVKKMMAADVEVGALLSGGVDSTLVTYFAQTASTLPLKTFSVGYEHYINELPFASQVSKKFGTDHYTLQARADMTDSLVAISRYLDEPHADPSNFPQYLVSKLAGSKVKVALTGDGADELFMGYGWYWKHHNLSWKKHFFEKAFPRPFRHFIKELEIFTQKEKNQLWIEPFRPQSYIPETMFFGHLDDTQKINLFDLSIYLPGKLLAKVDRTAMANSLETRCPFLDREFAEFAYNLPQDFKIDTQNGKLILKDILSDIMPKEFVYRRKQGFGAPVKEWLGVAQMKELIHETFASGNAPLYGYIRQREVQRIIHAFYEKKEHASHYKVWSLLCLALWFQYHTA